ncbi:MAG: hypothetical protein KGR17_09855, partial [Acidobacteria bacterium]|nr:hypothetical protein [Acidobacteriota bacterium]
MLRQGDERSTTLAPRRRQRRVEAAQVIDLRDRSRTDDVIIEQPLRALPQQERRAVGWNLRALGHVVDAVALAGPFLFINTFRTDLVSIRVVALFVVVGTLLLWPTHRRGR